MALHTEGIVGNSHPTDASQVADQDWLFDDDSLHEECGVFGIVTPEQESAAIILFALYGLQHRGQDAAGIYTSDGSVLTGHKKRGLLAQVFNDRNLRDIHGHMGIGHTRYTTSSSNKPRFVQPIHEKTEGSSKAVVSELAFEFNGNLSNTQLLIQFLKEKKLFKRGMNDTLMMSAMLWHFLQETGDATSALQKCWPFWVGAYSALVLLKDSVVGVRGPEGIRPLVLGHMAGGFALASESAAFNSVGVLVGDVQPGHVATLTSRGFTSQEIARTGLKSDVFEIIYFARPDSIIMGRSAYEMRVAMGRELALEHPIAADIVVPVPNTAIPFAEGYAEALGLKMSSQVLVRNNYIARTFIQPTQEQRKLSLKYKFNVIPGEVVGKRVVLIDDSIVRGSTLAPLVEMLLNAGAAEVHVMSGSPPIRYPNFYGIATPHQKDLVAAWNSPEEIARKYGATSVSFLSYKGMLNAIGIPEEQLDTSCLTGRYPVDIGKNSRHIRKLDPIV